MKCRVKRHTVVQPLDQSYRLIPLTQGKSCIVDAEDFKWLSAYNWCASKGNNGRFYAVRKCKKKTTCMHRQILGCKPDEQADHRNNDGLDNRRINLRKCTHAENERNRGKTQRNSSGFKGVHWFRPTRQWRAAIQSDGKMQHIGLFKKVEDAARAYDKKARELHGSFAHTNFPN